MKTMIELIKEIDSEKVALDDVTFGETEEEASAWADGFNTAIEKVVGRLKQAERDKWLGWARSFKEDLQR